MYANKKFWQFFNIHPVVCAIIKLPANASHVPKQVAQCRMSLKCFVCRYTFLVFRV